ncbi:PREDICTED: eukaryotic translation initiation factor 2-alpha kinase 4-like [Priapulus caudatus]|uniref:non-specific serine/threonine protein kinase n=1 Tax=Priapulus caudatus TaxID=37621 RepID=A0ABM1EM99_PRICU|nr:PREDICTED: eukaryotic translation initiation factor 2-alpha kinase 4-like [Priapulus caudatus]
MHYGIYQRTKRVSNAIMETDKSSGESDNSYEARQEEEIEVLKAIYENEFEDIRGSDPWKVWRPPEIRLSLIPTGSSSEKEIHSQLQLWIKCSAKYPDEEPEVELENSKGLSKLDIQQLMTELHGIMQELRGEVMMLQLAQHVQEYLHKHNTPRFKSFYEEMLSNNRKKQEKLAVIEQKKVDQLKKREEQEYQVIEAEIRKRQEILKIRVETTNRQTPESTIVRDTSPVPCSPLLVKQLSVAGSPTKTCKIPVHSLMAIKKLRKGARHARQCSEDTIRADDDDDIMPSYKPSTITFSGKEDIIIQKGKYLGRGSLGSTAYVGMDKFTGQLVVVCEWVLQWHLMSMKMGADEQQTFEKEANQYRKQLSSIEQELSSLLKLSHPNLVSYLAMKFSIENTMITIQVLKEFVNGPSLTAYVGDEGIPLPMEHLYRFTHDMLEGLAYLHSKAVVHKDLRESSVFVNSCLQAQIADYSLDKRIAELCSLANGGDDLGSIMLVPGRGGKKADIFRLGMVVLSLATGLLVTDTSEKVPTSLPALLQDFLEKCLAEDERDRWSAQQLLDHSFLKPTLSLMPPTGQRNKREENKAEGEHDSDLDTEIPLIWSRGSTGQSRLKNEFEILKFLGKGGFGDVIKVRNKLDSCVYAIKRIPLNPKSRQLNKKITREVKLLSRLNHDNVVRYYNSWIETGEERQTDADESTSFTPSSSLASTSDHAGKKSIGDSLEMLLNNDVGEPIEWSVSDGFPSNLQQTADDDDDNDDDDEEEYADDVFGTFLPFGNEDEEESSDGIVFEGSWKPSSGGAQPSTDDSAVSARIESNSVKVIQFMYIQMEYCEKSTLRNLIDIGLDKDTDLVWRLFREIIEGLAHLHQQGMIHRDLKPVNIFLDSNNHVKIGDFGLATMEMISGLKDIQVSAEGCGSAEELLGQEGLTGKVGTALYVSPELMAGTGTVSYNQKVDIYSLGVIFFEMCYPKPSTTMERVKIIGQLREPQIVLPPDFDGESSEAVVIQWLLNHDPAHRPTSQELLQSHHLPPPQLEEAQLSEVLRHTISNNTSSGYHRMMNTLFSQPVTPAADFTYDMDIHKGSFTNEPVLLQQHVLGILVRVFRRHGAIRLATPLLVPRCRPWEQNDQCVRLLDHSGLIVDLPLDLRVPFARYIARNSVSSLKRYCVEKVYRDRKIFGCHPRELTECVFDIVTSSAASLVADAEVLSVVCEIVDQFPVLQTRSYHIKLNHALLLKAILMHCDIPEELHNDVFTILNESKVEKLSCFQVQTKLCNLSLSDKSVTMLYNFIDVEGPLNKIVSMMRTITKRSGEAGVLAKQGLHELEIIQNHLTHFGAKIQVFVNLGLVLSVQYYSGMFFQFAREMKKRRRKGGLDILAVGGRYDKLVAEYRRPSLVAPLQHVVGVSIAFEKLTAAAHEHQEVRAH